MTPLVGPTGGVPGERGGRTGVGAGGGERSGHFEGKSPSSKVKESIQLRLVRSGDAARPRLLATRFCREAVVPYFGFFRFFRCPPRVCRPGKSGEKPSCARVYTCIYLSLIR